MYMCIKRENINELLNVKKNVINRNPKISLIIKLSRSKYIEYYYPTIYKYRVSRIIYSNSTYVKCF